MSKVSNVITMLELLQSGRKYSISELSNKLEVSERMIRVYKEDLEKAGIYIDTIMGPYGGYVLNQSIRIPIRKFKVKDAELLDKYIKEEKDKDIKEKLILLQDKIKGVYIGSKQEEKELNLKDETAKKYNALTRAIKEKRKVKILYYSYGKGENERVIDPAEMFLFQNGWCCAAFCERKQDMRHFELKRIIKYELLEEKYE
ncbi:MAG: WYL domain-containing protein [Bacilli bacterium]|nr:WYL domain-containing protein [Bacilli bacterium]